MVERGGREGRYRGAVQRSGKEGRFFFFFVFFVLFSFFVFVFSFGVLSGVLEWGGTEEWYRRVSG